MTSPSALVSGCLGSIQAAGIPYAVLHGVDRLPDVVTSDIDIVVGTADLDRLGAVLGSFASERGGLLVQRIRHEATAVYYVLALPCEQSRIFLKIDACSDYRRDGVVLFDAEELLRSTREENGLRAVAAETEVAYLFAKRALKVNRWDDDTAQWLVEAARSMPVDVDRALRRVVPRLADEVLQALNAQETEYFQSHADGLRRETLRAARNSHRIASLAYWPRESVRRMSRAFRPTGYHVALLGPDGVGKTMLAEAITTGIADAFRRTSIHHLRPTLLPGRTSTVTAGTAPYARKPLNPTLSALKMLYLWSDYVVGYWLRVYPAKVRSTLIVYDRYFADVVVDPKRYRYAGPTWLARLALRLSPAPDLYLVLIADAELIQSRKSEMSVEQTALLAEAYRVLPERMSGAVEVVAAHDSPDRVAWDATERVLRRLNSRVRSWMR